MNDIDDQLLQNNVWLLSSASCSAEGQAMVFKLDDSLWCLPVKAVYTHRKRYA
jgi:hypothetical protein